MPYSDPIYSSTALLYGDDANYDVQGDAYDGAPTKVSPSTAELQQGARPARQLGAQAFNWFTNQFKQLIAALKSDGERVEDDFIAYQAAQTALLAQRKAEWLAEWGQLPALNALRRITGLGNLVGAFYSAFDDQWYLHGESGTLYRSDNQGISWSTNLVTSVEAGEFTVSGIATDAGHVCVSTKTRYVFTYNANTDAVTKTDTGAATHTPGQKAFVGYDPVTPKVVWLGTNGASQIIALRADPFGSGACSAATAGPSGSWSMALCAIATKPSTGRIVFIGEFDTDSVNFAYTDDGGDNWVTDGFNHGSPITTPTDGSVCYNAATDTWTYVVSSTTSNQTRIFQSTDDGESWTLVASLNATALLGISVVDADRAGRLYIATATTGEYHGGDRVLYSVDNCLTWRNAGIRVGAEGSLAARMCASGGGGAMIVSSGGAISTARLGAPGNVFA